MQSGTYRRQGYKAVSTDTSMQFRDTIEIALGHATLTRSGNCEPREIDVIGPAVHRGHAGRCGRFAQQRNTCVSYLVPGFSGRLGQGIGLELVMPHGLLLCLPHCQILLHLHL